MNMKEIKLKERLENAFESFFDNENLENNVVVSSNESNILYETKSKMSNKSLRTIFNILRQVLLYFPGVTMLFTGTFFLTCWHLHPRLGFGIIVSDYKFYWIIGFLGIFLSILGIGDIRKPKHFVIPASIILFSFAVGIIFALSGFGGITLYNLIVNCVGPFILTIPFFAKMFVDDLEEK